MLKHEGLIRPPALSKWSKLIHLRRCNHITFGVRDLPSGVVQTIGHAFAMMQVRHILAGTAARTMAQAFIHPIDTVKTRLQVPPNSASPN